MTDPGSLHDLSEALRVIGDIATRSRPPIAMDDKQTITLAVIDGHRLIRDAVVELLRTDPEIAVVADGATGAEAISIAREQQPQVMLLESDLPDGVEETLLSIRELSPITAIVILTMDDDPFLVGRLLEIGAVGYVLKGADSSHLFAAIHSAAVGGAVFLSVSRTTIEAVTGSLAGYSAQVLSPREREVLRLLASALSNSEIATELYISRSTVKRHLTNICGKLGAEGRIDALMKARAAGVIEAAG
ncbi:response regulator [Nocardia sp. SYP-A9097]|uniref:LuxR C-terminal-related transcriptional regulator n=1 Tax=Nocardia sp. SYP-A9097 TaxID=2663237 RepID=UPI00129B85A2|nr:response regulator transcription factor [Nocardia sp. SYP-A9097]MRH87967.1 response regulator [Nocardia sp. SYP-A9097]